MVIKDRVFFISGADSASRRLIIENIKKKTLKANSSPLNVLTFYPKEIDIKDLQEKVSLSSFDGEKILIFKDIYSLPKEVKDFLFGNINKIISGNFIIFEAEGNVSAQNKKISADKFFNLILAKAACFKAAGISQESSFEDFKRSIRQGNNAEAIYVLNRLFEQKSSDNEKKTLGLQLFGILINEFSGLKNDTLRKKYLNYLLDADRKIKERGFDPKFAIELFLSRNLAG